MIVRSLPDGSTALIGQTDHSRLVGQLAAHWGNGQFATPEPYDAVARAAVYHDFGWLDYETRPLIDPESGKPYEFRQLPFTTEQLAAYGRWIDWLTAIDPYAALLVSRHRTGLWQNRYGTITHPGGAYNPKGMRPEIQAFIGEAEKAQETLAPGHDRAVFDVNYHLLQVWDLLGLYFCCGEPFEQHIEPVPTGYGNGKTPTVRLEVNPRGPREVAFTPYPFAERPLQVEIGYKQLATDQFENLDAFRRAYWQAESRLLTYTLV